MRISHMGLGQLTSDHHKRKEETVPHALVVSGIWRALCKLRKNGYDCEKASYTPPKNSAHKVGGEATNFLAPFFL